MNATGQFIPMYEIPQALWVVASTVDDPRFTRLGPEQPLAYCFGYINPLSELQQRSLEHYLLLQSTLLSVRRRDMSNPRDAFLNSLSVSFKMTNPDCATDVYEVIVGNPQNRRQAIADLKSVVRPECPYTALVLHSVQKLAGNTGLMWVAVRDSLSANECKRLLEQFPKLRVVHSATLRGLSTFELRVDYSVIKKRNLMISHLAVLGIFPDFVMETGDTVYTQAL